MYRPFSVFTFCRSIPAADSFWPISAEPCVGSGKSEISSAALCTSCALAERALLKRWCKSAILFLAVIMGSRLIGRTAAFEAAYLGSNPSRPVPHLSVCVSELGFVEGPGQKLSKASFQVPHDAMGKLLLGQKLAYDTSYFQVAVGAQCGVLLQPMVFAFL